MYHDLNRLQSVFLAAVQSADANSRASLLDRECAGDDELRRWVCEMLRKHDRADLAVDTPALNSLSTLRGKSIQADLLNDDEVSNGTLIAGRYKLIDRLGQGGMGSVFQAEQIAPARRTVAVKLIKPGFHTKSMLARFESEWQALARMDHPHIARMYDAGTIETDSAEKIARPFFVMEFIDGIPITKYCVQHKLTWRQRLDLFIPICLAIEHAHQKGIIHRDLKPSNILVTKRDDQPNPVVIDFGIAKHLEPGLGYTTDETGTGVFLGSLDYMAPEQAERGTTDVDTRSDVYSLGAVLYELLCAAVPFDPERLRRASVFELATILLEEEPIRPSERLTANTQLAVSAGYPNPTRIAADLRGDLDWIVAKCLEKNRDQRYQSARTLAEDLSRCLRNEPVSAGPPTVKYRVGKFVRRYRGPVVAASLVLLGLIGGIAGTTWGMVRAWRAEANAISALEERGRALAAQEVQRKRADNEAANAQAVSQFFQVDVIRQANIEWQLQMEYSPDTNLTVRTALDRAASTIENRFRDQPALEAQIRRSMGYAYDGLGEYTSAVNQLRRALAISEKQWGTEHESTIKAKYELGTMLLHSGRADQAIPNLELALAWRQAHLGSENDSTLQVETDLGMACGSAGRFDDAERHLNHVLTCVRSSGPVNTCRALYNLACLDGTRGKIGDAITRLESLPSCFPNNDITDLAIKVRMHSTLGRLYIFDHRPADAIRSLESARECASAIWSEEHPQSAALVILLSSAYWEAGRVDDAGGLLDHSLTRLRSKLGSNHVRVHEMSNELARWAVETGDRNRADALSRETLNIAKNSVSLYWSIRASALVVQGRSLCLANQPGDAEPALRDALEIYATRSKDEWKTAEARILLGLALAAQNRYADAQPELEAGMAILKRQDGRAPYHARRLISEAADALVRCAAARGNSESK